MTAKEQARHHLPILAFGLLSAVFIVGMGLLALAIWIAMISFDPPPALDTPPLVIGVPAFALGLVILSITGPGLVAISRYSRFSGRRLALGTAAAYTGGTALALGLWHTCYASTGPANAASAASIATLATLTCACLVGARPLRALVALIVPAGLAAVASYWWLSGYTDAISCPWYRPPTVVETPIPTATSGRTSPSNTAPAPADGTKPPTTVGPSDATTTSLS